jgi:DENN domain-containing protein 5
VKDSLWFYTIVFLTDVVALSQPPGFSSTEIRRAFLRFFTSLFQTYRSYLDGTEFRSLDFLASLNILNGSAEFVAALLGTQMFQGFVVERGESPYDPEVLFFDDSINAKINRSKTMVLTGRKKETSFLNDTRSMVSSRGTHASNGPRTRCH